MRGATVLVLGCGDVGSAVGHGLFGAGLEVLLCDLPAPAHARRGMAYTDALFDGRAVLDGVAALRIDSLAELDGVWSARVGIPVIAWPEARVLEARRFDVLIDATMRRQRAPSDIRTLAPLAIGLGPGFAPGVNCHVAVESQWGPQMGTALEDRATAPLAGGPKPLDGIGRERFVAAPESGRWRTRATLGAPVAAGELVGRLGDHEIRAPLAGHLRGVTRDGVEVRAGQRIVEIDPRAQPQIFGRGERPLAIAAGVLRALGHERRRA